MKSGRPRDIKAQSDRTTVQISKEVQRRLKIAAAHLGVTQKSLLERIIIEWLRGVSYETENYDFKEEQ